MRVVAHPREMQEAAEELRRSGKTIAFVPTMGYLHEGHASLLHRARELGDIVVLSIFVNPTQFAPTEDLSKYPRDFARDSVLADKAGTDIIFHPDASSMYPDGGQTEIVVRDLIKPLCGVNRPAHFQGVATVCCKLFNIVKPHYAVFGEKDYQQYLVVDRMVRDLDMDLAVVPHPTVRESDGLAMSSRNVYLSPDERRDAVHLSRALQIANRMCDAGERNASRILDVVREEISQAISGKTDYIELRDAKTLRPVEDAIEGPSLLAVAVKFGGTRLIDNTILLRQENPRMF